MADPVPYTEQCRLELKCSSTGKACAADDRQCQSAAIADGLEILCEQKEPPGYVYCPPGAEQRDGSVVWILLVVAGLIAVFGGLVAYLVLRRRLRTE